MLPVSESHGEPSESVMLTMHWFSEEGAVISIFIMVLREFFQWESETENRWPIGTEEEALEFCPSEP